MQHDKLVNVVQAAYFGWSLCNEILALVKILDLAVMLDDPALLQAIREKGDSLDPNTPLGLAWQSIKACAKEFL